MYMRMHAVQCLHHALDLAIKILKWLLLEVLFYHIKGRAYSVLDSIVFSDSDV